MLTILAVAKKFSLLNIKLVTLFLILISRDIAVAQPKIKIKTHYYSVAGKTLQQISRNLYTQSPIVYQGKKYHGYTKWNVNWWFYWNDYGSHCQIKSVQTSVDVQYTLPKLSNYSSLTNPVKQKWDRYYHALSKHEEGHKNFGVSAAQEIEKSIAKMGSRKTCQQLEQDANSIGKQIIQKYVIQEKNYDKTTNHGVTQGAIFP
jgi:predicted secreted Zn-dependent protease